MQIDKKERPVTIWIIVGVLAGVFFLLAYYCIIHPNTVTLVLAATALLGVYGLIKNKFWSQYIVLMIFGFIGLVLNFNVLNYINKHGWPYNSIIGNASYIFSGPGVLALCIIVIVLVFRYFYFYERAKNKDDTA